MVELKMIIYADSCFYNNLFGSLFRAIAWLMVLIWMFCDVHSFRIAKHRRNVEVVDFKEDDDKRRTDGAEMSDEEEELSDEVSPRSAPMGGRPWPVGIKL